MVGINATELEVYTNIIGVGYSVRDGASIDYVRFPIGETMLLVKQMADTSETVAELGLKVLTEALAVADGK